MIQHISRLLIFLTLVLFSKFGNAQGKNLEVYIPREKTTLLTHPVITLKVKLYLIYRYKEDAQNYTSDSSDLIYKQFDWINGFYQHLSPNTLISQDSIKHFIPDSRIKFRVDTLLSYVDSVDWDRIYIAKQS